MFEIIHERAKEGGITLGDFFALLGNQGHQLLILFLALPFLQPIPLLGLSTPLGILIGLVALLHFRGQPPLIPARFKKLEISKRVLNKTVEVGRKLWSLLDRLAVRPRFLFFIEGRVFRLLNLFLAVTLGFLLSLPLPVPFSNTVPAFCLVIHSLAQIRRDGALVFLSYCIFFGTLTFFWGVILGALWFFKLT
jgi:hypothetical protein